MVRVIPIRYGAEPPDADRLAEIDDRSVATIGEAGSPAAAGGGEQRGSVPGAEDIAALKAERDEWRERCLRAVADLENLRKTVDARVAADVFALEKRWIERWLPMGDALDRAVARLEDAPVEWVDGVRQVAALFDAFMAGADVRKIDRLDRFDPAIHEAMGIVSDPAREDGAVAKVVRSGWMRGDRLVRPAGVIVVRNSRPQSAVKGHPSA